MHERSRDLKSIQRRCTNREIRAVVIKAIKGGCRYKVTRSGIVFYGDNGLTAGTHFTVSDHRAHKNLTRDLARAGININFV